MNPRALGCSRFFFVAGQGVLIATGRLVAVTAGPQ